MHKAKTDRIERRKGQFNNKSWRHQYLIHNNVWNIQAKVSKEREDLHNRIHELDLSDTPDHSIQQQHNTHSHRCTWDIFQDMHSLAHKLSLNKKIIRILEPTSNVEGVVSPATNSQTPAGCLTIQLNSNRVYLQTASDSAS